MALEAGICYHMATLSEISLTYSRTGRGRLSTQCKAVGQEEGIALFESCLCLLQNWYLVMELFQLSNLFMT
jgi:hypothetical protein